MAGKNGRSDSLQRESEAVIERNRALPAEVLESLGRDMTFFTKFTFVVATTRDAEGSATERSGVAVGQ
jgi:hypothetical protein